MSAVLTSQNNAASIEVGVDMPSRPKSAARNALWSIVKPKFWIEADPTYIKNKADGTFKAILNIANNRYFIPANTNAPIIAGLGAKTALQLGFGGSLSSTNNGSLIDEFATVYGDGNVNYVKAFVFALNSTTASGGTILGSAISDSNPTGSSWWISYFDRNNVHGYQEKCQIGTTDIAGNFTNTTWHSLVFINALAGSKVIIDGVETAGAGIRRPDLGGAQWQFCIGAQDVNASENQFFGSIKALVFAPSCDAYADSVKKDAFVNYVEQLRLSMNAT